MAPMPAAALSLSVGLWLGLVGSAWGPVTPIRPPSGDVTLADTPAVRVFIRSNELHIESRIPDPPKLRFDGPHATPSLGAISWNEAGRELVLLQGVRDAHPAPTGALTLHLEDGAQPPNDDGDRMTLAAAWMVP